MKKYILLLSLLFLGYTLIKAQPIAINEGLWGIECNDENKKLVITYAGKSFLEEAYAEVRYNLPDDDSEILIKSFECDNISFSQDIVSDNFGEGIKYIIRYEFTVKSIILEQCFYFYEGSGYFLSEIVAKHNNIEIASNYLAPLVSETTSSFLSKSASNRMLWVPWDNDAWVRYNSYELKQGMTSHEVAAVYNGESRAGVIIGSVEHDLWKSGVKIEASDTYNINSFSCFSGYVSEYSRDVLPHGKVKGHVIRSAKFMFGYYDDWRLGMEEYGNANTKIASRAQWDGGKPFGWSSWGVMQDKVSYTGATNVAEFLKNELGSKGFHDTEGKTVLSLDAWWNDNISPYNMIRFAEKCAGRNQIAGIYYGPFCDWSGDPEREVEGTNGQYRYKDIWLKVNGGKHSQGGVCIDPTHPGTKMAMKYNLERYKSWGYKYIKVDFLTNGAIEGDSYYNPEVMTGTQAYNEGMQYMFDLIGDDMYIVLAISPLFPYQYAHGRRTCCDSYSHIGETEYVMNSTSYGWWTNQLYQVNDPDHLVLLQDGRESYAENRARTTSGAVTGAFIFGDNFSDNVDKGFPEESRERALIFMANEDINNMVRECGSFKPVEGHKATASNSAENLLMYETDKYIYMAGINYYSSIRYVTGTMTFERLGIDASRVESVKELWTDADIAIKNGGFIYSIAPSDARIYRILKKDAVGIESGQKIEGEVAKISQYPHLLIINSYKQMKEVALFDVNGTIIYNKSTSDLYDMEVNTSLLPQGAYILKIGFVDGTYLSRKILRKN